ncbi:MAG TPA: hypothetical protein VM716_13245 [Gemmatimonadales bacterium]|nr:hypothetical protein [Gemmatimonadales bacterium]
MEPGLEGALAEPQWARLRVDVNCRLRRGAWYRVAGLRAGEAMLDVNRHPVPVPRTSLKIVTKPPQCWTVVSLPRDAKGLAAMWGGRYAVCPSCRNRAQLKGTPSEMRCSRCIKTYRVAWEEWFMGPADR